MTKTPNPTPQPNYPDQIIGNNQQPGAEHAVNAAPFAADLRGIDQSTAPALPTTTDLRPHLEWALRRISTSLGEGEHFAAAQRALDEAAFPASPAQQDAPAAQPARECLQQSADAVEALAHRIAWRYKKSSDPHHSDTYTFNAHTLHQFATALQAAPPAPEAVAVSGPRDAFEDWALRQTWIKDCQRNPEGVYGHYETVKAWAAWQARATLAAAPAQAQGASRAITIDFKQATELLEMFGGEPTEVTLIEGNGHSGAGLYASYTDMPEEGSEFLGVHDDEAVPAAPAQAVAVPEGLALVPVEPTPEMLATYGPGHADLLTAIYRAMLAAAPEQEHATQLEGQGQEPAAWLASYQDREGNEASYVTTHYALAVENDARGQPVALYPAAAPVHAQEDARNEALVEHVVSAARNAVDGALDAMDDFTIESHLVAALSLALDELDAARAAQGE